MSDVKLLPPPRKSAVIVHARNPFQVDDREIYQVTEPVTIREWLDRQGIDEFPLPTICLVDGDPVLRSEWPTRRIEPGSVVAFVAMPGAVGGIIVGGLFGAGFAASTAGLLLAAVTNVGISFGLSQLANLLIGAPKTPSTRAARDQAAASPTYSIQAQGNAARLGASIPGIYGEPRVFPDWATAPYTEFEGGEQYLYQLFSIGLGEYDVLDQRIEDTPFASFPECTVLGIYGPGQPVTTLPAAVYTSVEVANQELLQGQWIGHFIVNPAGTSISQVAVDVVAPYGMYYANDLGGLDSRGATFTAEVATVDDAGNLTSAFSPIGAESITAATNNPIRKSYRYTLPSSGRWAVRMTRTNAKDTSSRAGNTIQWTNLRGYTTGAATYPGVTTVATRFRASNNLSEQSSRRVNFKVARKLQTWNPATRQWGAAVRTRSIAWALADICRASYGAGLADSRYDIDGLYALEQTLAARNAVYGPTGDWCDVVFDNAVTVWEALVTVARLGRAMPVIQGGVVRFVRDQSQSLYTAMFTPRNIVKGSFAIEYVMPSDETADAVTVEYWDAEALRPREVTASLAGSSVAKPAKVKLAGCTSQAHAWREGMYMAAANRYRRKAIKFQTELEGHIPMVGDLIVVAHDMPAWGVGGEIVDYDAGTKTFTLSEPVSFGAGNHYLALRRRDGGISGPWLVVEAVPPDPYKVMLGIGQTLDITPYTGGAEERTHFAFGKAGTADNFQLFRVMAPIRYRGDSLVELTAVNEHSFVHTADSGEAPPIPNPALLPTRPTRPVLTALAVTQSGTPDAPVLNVSWQAAAGATHYLVELSRDNENWSRVADSLTTSIRVPVEPGVWWVRVAAAGLAVGPFLSQQITAGEVPPPGVVQGLAQAETFTGTQARIQWTPTPRATHYRLEVWAAGVKRRDVTTTVPAYAYSAEDVTKDGGPWRSLTFRVWAVSEVGESDNYAELTLSNPAPGALTGVSVYAGVKSVMITYTRPTDLDFSEVIVCMSTTQGFTPDPETNLAYRGSDRTITIPNLAEDTTYYFRLAAADTFGIDGLDFGANEYQATITSLNLPTPTEVKDALQEALSDPAATPLVFEADTFAVNMAGTDRFPFIIGQVEGQDVIQLDANVYVLGTLSASQIRSGDIAVDQQIRLGNGNVVLDGAGAMIVYDPNSPDPDHPDFALFTAGRLTFQVYRGGEYQEQKAVKRVEFGVANSGETVLIPGYWDSQPKLMIGPKSLMSYDKDYSSQEQTWLVEARNLHETSQGSQQWQFDAVAELNLAANSGTTTTGSSQGWSSTNTFTSLAYNLVGNTSQVTVTFSAGSYRGTGTGTYVWAYRAVRWKVQLYNNALGQWQDANTFRVISMTAQGAVQSAKQDSVTVAVSSAHTQIRIYAEAYDSGGAYTTGGNAYNYTYGGWSATNTNQATASAGGNPNGFPGWTPDAVVYHATNAPAGIAGWEVIGYQYYYEWRSARPSGSQHSGYVAGPGVYYTTPGGTAAYDTGWAGVYHGVYYEGFNANKSYVHAHANNIGTFNAVDGYIRNTTARAYLRQLIVNSPTPANYFQFASFAWVTPSAQTLAAGSINWMAVGE